MCMLKRKRESGISSAVFNIKFLNMVAVPSGARPLALEPLKTSYLTVVDAKLSEPFSLRAAAND